MSQSRSTIHTINENNRQHKACSVQPEQFFMDLISSSERLSVTADYLDIGKQLACNIKPKGDDTEKELNGYNIKER